MSRCERYIAQRTNPHPAPAGSHAPGRLETRIDLQRYRGRLISKTDRLERPRRRLDRTGNRGLAYRTGKQLATKTGVIFDQQPSRDLTNPEVVEVIRPLLHHFAALRKMSRAVVSSAIWISHSVG